MSLIKKSTVLLLWFLLYQLLIKSTSTGPSSEAHTHQLGSVSPRCDSNQCSQGCSALQALRCTPEHNVPQRQFRALKSLHDVRFRSAATQRSKFAWQTTTALPAEILGKEWNFLKFSYLAQYWSQWVQSHTEELKSIPPQELTDAFCCVCIHLY